MFTYETAAGHVDLTHAFFLSYSISTTNTWCCYGFGAHVVPGESRNEIFRKS